MLTQALKLLYIGFCHNMFDDSYSFWAWTCVKKFWSEVLSKLENLVLNIDLSTHVGRSFAY